MVCEQVINAGKLAKSTLKSAFPMMSLIDFTTMSALSLEGEPRRYPYLNLDNPRFVRESNDC